jgi:hypothetical protein
MEIWPLSTIGMGNSFPENHCPAEGDHQATFKSLKTRVKRGWQEIESHMKIGEKAHYFVDFRIKLIVSNSSKYHE